MKNTVKILFSALIVAGLAVSCNCDDISYWTPEAMSPKIIGTVYTNGQVPLANATVTMVLGGKTYTVVTDADGKYEIDNLNPGTAEVTASYPSDASVKSATKDAVLANNEITICNFLLCRSNNEVIKEKVGDDDLYKIQLPDVVQEDKSVTQIATFYANEGTLPEDDELLLEAWYEVAPKTETKSYDDYVPSENDEGYKYTNDDVIIHVTSESKLGNKPLKSILVTIDELIEPRLVLHNGEEVAAETQDDAVTYFNTSKLGHTIFYYPILLKTLEYGTDELEIEPEILYGPGSRYEVKALINSGIQYYLKNTFLDQYVLMITMDGDHGYSYVNYVYNQTIPAGESIYATGTQGWVIQDWKCGFAHVGTKEWYSPGFSLKDRKHTGGSN